MMFLLLRRPKSATIARLRDYLDARSKLLTINIAESVLIVSPGARCNTNVIILDWIEINAGGLPLDE